MSKVYDLNDRTKKFAVEIIKFCKTLSHSDVNRIIINQLVRSATRVGANYSEADEAESPKDFKHKIGIAKKEARETKFFLEVMIETLDYGVKDLENLQKESSELCLILNSIYKKIKDKGY